MGKLFDNPMFIVLILLVIVLLFGAPKLPGICLLYTSDAADE